MSDITGLHHVTAISGAPRSNRAFWEGALGLRMVKRTVNFDDPTTYHLYYGDETGSAGSAMTFFAWDDAARGRVGAGQALLTQFAVPHGALDFWRARLPAKGAREITVETVFGEARAVFEAPDGLPFSLSETNDPRAPWTTAEIGDAVAIRGFHGVTLGLHDGKGAERVLTEVFGYAREAEEACGAARLLRLRATGPAPIVDLRIDPALPAGREGVGTVHHVAFSVPDDAAHGRVRERMAQAGLRVTERIDRCYFRSIYARIPGGVLFEVATDGPGFEVDEPRDRLGAALMLPPQHERSRARIEAVLPALD